jgi:xylan 1,4-beta-xylosidase
VYSSYTAAQIARTYELADLHKINLQGTVTWAFEFEDQPYFAGFRDLATNGIDKPVLNVFRMLGMMRGDRLHVDSSSAAPIQQIRDEGVRVAPDIYALAASAGREVSVLVWHYHDDDLPADAADVTLTIEGLAAGRPTLTHYRIDQDHSNAYTVWKSMGSPPTPTSGQRATLEHAGQLQTLEAPRQLTVDNGRASVTFTLPRQGVSLLKLTW